MNHPVRRKDVDDGDIPARVQPTEEAARPPDLERAVAHASPARELQQRLVADWGAGAAALETEARWSPRRALAFMVGASLLLWGGIGWLALTILR